MPTIDAMFGDVFYPPSLLIGLLFPVHRAIGIKMILHIFLAGLFFFLLLRKGFKFSPLVSFIGAAFYMLNPQFLTHVYPGHDGKMFVIAWLPFIVWRLKVLTERPTLLHLSFFSLGVSMTFLTAHMQMCYFMLWGVFFYWVLATALIIIREHDTKKAVKLGCFFWASIFISLGVALVQLYPSYMYVHNAFSVRGVERGFEHAASWSLHWPEVFSLWIPEFVNTLDYYWGNNPFKLNSEYAGAVPLLLAVLAIVMKPNRWRIFWGAVALFSIAFSLGGNSFIFQLTYYLVPGVKKFRAASMFMFWFSFSNILLASLLMKDLVENKLVKSEYTKKKLVKGLLIAAGLMVGLALLFSVKSVVSGFFATTLIGDKSRVFDANFGDKFIPALWLWVLFALSLVGVLIGVMRNVVKPKLALMIFLVIGLIDVIRIDAQFIQLTDPAPYFYKSDIVKKLEQEMKTEPFRCYSIPGSLSTNGEGIHSLEGVGGFHDNELRWYRDFRGENDRNYLESLISTNADGQPYLQGDRLAAGNPFLNIANVKYILVRQGTLMAIENKNALGRVSFAKNYVVLDSASVVKGIMSGSYDYRNTVALEKEPDTKPAIVADSGDVPFIAAWEKYSPNKRIVMINASSQGFLRISESYYPGWKISVDGRDVKIYKADGTFMAIEIPPGKHRVEMNINSLYFDQVKWISISITLLLLCFWMVVGVLRLKRTGAGKK
jgi:hypothetical protein